MNLHHYYDRDVGAFVSLSDLPIDEANAVMRRIKEHKPDSFGAGRDLQYMNRRHIYEEILRNEFTKKGGVVRRKSPHYFVVGHSPWLSTWHENSACVIIPIQEFDLETVSFTYGDSHPVFSTMPNKMDGKEYRRRLYTYDEILGIIEKYGLPQDWNDDGKHGPERYIEAHVWCDETVGKYRRTTI